MHDTLVVTPSNINWKNWHYTTISLEQSSGSCDLGITVAIVNLVPGTGADATVLAVARSLLLILADAIVQFQLPASTRLHTEIAIWTNNLSLHLYRTEGFS